eukprot:TRINITY_DN678_c0_g1_i1.p1 TRINITY_DN678_c0_g1~~TRINITY_DN678_c0_g1_i1.p1  ORF type:complete len:174 (+),score=42.04 TRINITY_DN678_c0_g1_i1:48-569(+)
MAPRFSLVGNAAVAALAFASNAAAFDDDDTTYCWDSRISRRVPAGACPHDCCWGDECGSDTECRRALIIGLVIGGVLLICAIVFGILLYLYCTKKSCFRQQESTVVYTEPVQQGQPVQGQPVQGYPLQQQGYPQQGYPPPAHQAGYPAPAAREDPAGSPPPPLAAAEVPPKQV